MAPLHPCPICSRHVRTDASRCPFCDAALDLRGLPSRPVPPPGLTREMLAVFGAVLAAGAPGCGLVHTRPEDTYYGAADAAYGGHDAGPWDAYRGGDDAYHGGSDAAYGGHDGGSR